MNAHSAEKDVSAKRETWRDLLEPWATRYMELVEAIREHCESLDDAALAALGRATHKPSQTNVWWATYRVAALIQSAVLEEKYRRHKERDTRVTPAAEKGQADA